MSKKSKIFIALGVIVAVSVIAAVTVIATSSYGTQSDPLVTKSYLDETVVPSLDDKLDSSIAAARDELNAEFDRKADEYLEDVKGELDEFKNSELSNGFAVISLAEGQSVSCSVGTEIMLRIGSVVSYGPSLPRLIDETTGSTLDYSGSSLVKNHMYMVTIQGNGVTAASSAKILIKGEYEIIG